MSRGSKKIIMLIGELAQQAGVTPDTIRFYEKQGLLDDRHRTRKDNNYKDYGPEALTRLRLISRAKCAGFTLREITQLFRDWETLTQVEWSEIFLEKIRQIERRMTEMAQMKEYLQAVMPVCLAKSAYKRDKNP